MNCTPPMLAVFSFPETQRAPPTLKARPFPGSSLNCMDGAFFFVV
jgi:hypothetical protein